MFPSELLTHSARLRVVSFRITETGTYNHQFNRPYETDMTAAMMNNVLYHTNKAMETGAPITPTLLAHANNGKPIVAPSAAVQSQVDIPNGWTERRFRFILTLDVHYNIGTVSRFYYTGYSTHWDMSHAKTLDPNMVFFVNSVVRTSMSRAMTPLQGLVQIERNMSGRHMIADNNWQGAFNPQQKWMMRPEDVFVQMTSSELMGGNDVVIDTRNMSQTSAAMSNLSNGLSHNFASSIINAYAKASRVAPTYGNDDGCLTDAMTMLQVTNTNDENPLMAAVSQLRGVGIIQNNFTINDLLQIDPNSASDEITTFHPLEIGDVIHHAGQTREWSGQDNHTMAAIKISQALPALMGANLIQNVRIVSTNNTVNGQPHTVVTGIGYNQANLPQRNQALGDRFDNELVLDISNANGWPYYVEVIADALGETRIKVSIDHTPLEEFVSPSFADNLLAPIITTNQNSFVRVASDFNSLLSDISVTGQQKFNQSLDTLHL